MDDFSRAVWVFRLKDKSETYHRLVEFCAMVQNQFHSSVLRVRSDNGSEFTNGPLRHFFRDKGILFETSRVDIPQQNGRVERKNRHLLNVVRALRFQSCLPVSFGENVS